MTADRPPAPAHRAVVDASAITHNLQQAARLAPGAHVMGVVKAGGYGHGALTAARAAGAAGAAVVGVAQPAEAVALRREGVAGPLVAWLLTPRSDLDEALAHDVSLGVAAPWALRAVLEAAGRTGAPAGVHLELDTGMSRGGVAPGDWRGVMQGLASAVRDGLVRLDGIFSHLACADEPGHPSVDHQRDQFEAGLAEAARAGLEPRWRHLANSAAVVTRPDLAYDLVRPGLLAYGLSPIPQLRTSAELGLRPAMTVLTELSAVRWVPAGAGISYGFTHVTRTPRWLGVVPLGYGDGVPRAASDRGPVRVHTDAGALDVRIAGRVCMDQVVVDLGPAPDTDPGAGAAPAAAGDRVELFGDGATGGPTAEDWAQACDTISYEVVTRLGPRVPRTVVGQA